MKKKRKKGGSGYQPKSGYQKKTQSKGVRFIKTAFVVLMVLAMIVLFCLGSFAPVFAETKDRNGLELGATGVAVYVGEYDSLLWEYQPDKRYNPASTTKLLTCLLAAERLRMEDQVTVTSKGLGLPNTAPYLQDGEEITVLDLMHMALMESSNEAATQLALQMADSIEDFALLMNERAAAIGCTDSEFHNPTGLDNPRNYATARDMCLITQEAMANETVREICSKASYKLPATNRHSEKKIKSTNLFLKGGSYTYSGSKIKVEAISEIYGGKTGTTVAGKATMCVAARINGMDVYITILNSHQEDRYNDIKKLINYVKTSLNPYMVFEEGSPIEEVARVKGGAVNKVKAVTGSDGLINLPEGASASLVTVTPVFQEELTAPIEQGQVIGEAEIRIADDYVRSVDLVAVSAVKEGWFLSDLGITNLATIIILTVLLLIVGFFILVAVLRSINKKKRAARRKEKLREMARREVERERDIRARDWPYK